MMHFHTDRRRMISSEQRLIFEVNKAEFEKGAEELGKLLQLKEKAKERIEAAGKVAARVTPQDLEKVFPEERQKSWRKKALQAFENSTSPVKQKAVSIRDDSDFQGDVNIASLEFGMEYGKVIMLGGDVHLADRAAVHVQTMRKDLQKQANTLNVSRPKPIGVDAKIQHMEQEWQEWGEVESALVTYLKQCVGIGQIFAKAAIDPEALLRISKADKDKNYTHYRKAIISAAAIRPDILPKLQNDWEEGEFINILNEVVQQNPCALRYYPPEWKRKNIDSFRTMVTDRANEPSVRRIPDGQTILKYIDWEDWKEFPDKLDPVIEASVKTTPASFFDIPSQWMLRGNVKKYQQIFKENAEGISRVPNVLTHMLRRPLAFKEYEYSSTSREITLGFRGALYQLFKANIRLIGEAYRYNMLDDAKINELVTTVRGNKEALLPYIRDIGNVARTWLTVPANLHELITHDPDLLKQINDPRIVSGILDAALGDPSAEDFAFVLRQLPDAVKEDRREDILSALVDQDTSGSKQLGRLFDAVPESWKSDAFTVLRVLRQAPSAYQHISPTLRANPIITYAAIAAHEAKFSSLFTGWDAVPADLLQRLGLRSGAKAAEFLRDDDTKAPSLAFATQELLQGPLPSKEERVKQGDTFGNLLAPLVYKGTLHPSVANVLLLEYPEWVTNNMEGDGQFNGERVNAKYCTPDVLFSAMMAHPEICRDMDGLLLDKNRKSLIAHLYGEDPANRSLLINEEQLKNQPEIQELNNQYLQFVAERFSESTAEQKNIPEYLLYSWEDGKKSDQPNDFAKRLAENPGLAQQPELIGMLMANAPELIGRLPPSLRENQKVIEAILWGVPEALRGITNNNTFPWLTDETYMHILFDVLQIDRYRSSIMVDLRYESLTLAYLTRIVERSPALLASVHLHLQQDPQFTVQGYVTYLKGLIQAHPDWALYVPSSIIGGAANAEFQKLRKTIFTDIDPFAQEDEVLTKAPAGTNRLLDELQLELIRAEKLLVPRLSVKMQKGWYEYAVSVRQAIADSPMANVGRIARDALEQLQRLKVSVYERGTDLFANPSGDWMKNIDNQHYPALRVVEERKVPGAPAATPFERMAIPEVKLRLLVDELYERVRDLSHIKEDEQLRKEEKNINTILDEVKSLMQSLPDAKRMAYLNPILSIPAARFHDAILRERFELLQRVLLGQPKAAGQ